MSKPYESNFTISAFFALNAFDLPCLNEGIKQQRQVFIFLRFFASPKKVAKKGEI
jgi:hypothetical protein